MPDPNSLCALWHVGHVAHRERYHIGKFLQGIEGDVIPPEFEVFVDDIRKSIGSIRNVLDWVREVRNESHKYIESLTEDDFLKVPPTSEDDLSIAHWLFITVAHSALHIGRIQMLRAMMECEKERAC